MFIRVLANILCVTALLAAAIAIFDSSSDEQTKFRIFGWLTCSSETHYAPGFSEDEFRSIPIGLSKSDVVERLGRPLERSAFHCDSPSSPNFSMSERKCPPGTDKFERWAYTTKPSKAKGYEVRAVFFGADDKISLVESFYLPD